MSESMWAPANRAKINPNPVRKTPFAAQHEKSKQQGFLPPGPNAIRKPRWESANQINNQWGNESHPRPPSSVGDYSVHATTSIDADSRCSTPSRGGSESGSRRETKRQQKERIKSIWGEDEKDSKDGLQVEIDPKPETNGSSSANDTQREHQDADGLRMSSTNLDDEGTPRQPVKALKAEEEEDEVKDGKEAENQSAEAVLPTPLSTPDLSGSNSFEPESLLTPAIQNTSPATSVSASPPSTLPKSLAPNNWADDDDETSGKLDEDLLLKWHINPEFVAKASVVFKPVEPEIPAASSNYTTSIHDPRRSPQNHYRQLPSKSPEKKYNNLPHLHPNPNLRARKHDNGFTEEARRERAKPQVVAIFNSLTRGCDFNPVPKSQNLPKPNPRYYHKAPQLPQPKQAPLPPPVEEKPIGEDDCPVFEFDDGPGGDDGADDGFVFVKGHCQPTKPDKPRAQRYRGPYYSTAKKGKNKSGMMR